jgi:hypothetical protein
MLKLSCEFLTALDPACPGHGLDVVQACRQLFHAPQ